MKGPLLYHGGVAGLYVGDVIYPDQAGHRYVDDCAHCLAQKEGRAGALGLDPETPEGWVYATADKPYARYYASRAVKGSLYRVRLEEDVEPSAEDPAQFHAFRGRRAVVVQVLERGVVMTHRERKQLFVRWGGTPEEYADLVAEAVRSARAQRTKQQGGRDGAR